MTINLRLRHVRRKTLTWQFRSLRGNRDHTKYVDRRTRTIVKGVAGKWSTSRANTQYLNTNRPAANTSGLRGGLPWLFPTGFFRDNISLEPPTQNVITAPTSAGYQTEREGYYFPLTTLKARTNARYGNGSFTAPYNIRARAETEARLKLADSDINIGVVIGEFAQTAGHLGSVISRLTTAYQRAKRRQWAGVADALQVPYNPKRFSKFSSNAAGGWLEFKYAWTPLMLDLQGGYDAFRKGMNESELTLSVQRNLTEKGSWKHPRGNDSFQILGEHVIDSRVKIFYKIDDPILHLMSSLGLTNPLSVAWELVPFSFVADWFLPIGPMVESLTSTLGLTFVSGYRTDCVKVVGSILEVGPKGDHSQYGEQRWAKQAYARHTYSAFPTPRPFVKSPFSGEHLVTAAALLRQLTRR